MIYNSANEKFWGPFLRNLVQLRMKMLKHKIRDAILVNYKYASFFFSF